MSVFEDTAVYGINKGSSPLHSASNNAYKTKQQTNKMEQKVDVFQERQELVQEVIDRMIYLPKYRRSAFKDKLEMLIRMYPIEFKEVNGVRVFEIVKEVENE